MTETLHEFARAGDVASSSAERLRKGTHKNVDVGRVNAKVVANTAAIRTKTADRVSLVDVEVELDRGSAVVVKKESLAKPTLYFRLSSIIRGRSTMFPSIE
jgi:hypothetical protein